MSLPDFTEQFGRIAALVAAAPGEDVEAITQELRAAERGLRTALAKTKIDISVPLPKGAGMVGINPDGLYVELEGQLQVSAFEKPAFTFAAYEQMAALVAEVESRLTPTRARR